MKKIKVFCKNNKIFACVAALLLIIIVGFGGNLFLGGQLASVLSISGSTSTTPTYSQYPSLSNSGYYLVTTLNDKNSYSQTLADMQTTMGITTRDTQALIDDYYKGGCTSATSSSCTSKITSILNSIYTYATYYTSYTRLVYENKNTIISNNTDWAGIASVSVVETLKTANIKNLDDLFAQLNNNIQKQFNLSLNLKSVATTSLTVGVVDPSLSGGVFVYSSSLAIDTKGLLYNLLKNKSSVLNISSQGPVPIPKPNLPTVSVVQPKKEGFLASVFLAISSILSPVSISPSPTVTPVISQPTANDGGVSPSSIVAPGARANCTMVALRSDGYQVCCPTASPYYNFTNGKCYATAAGSHIGEVVSAPTIDLFSVSTSTDPVVP